MKSNLLCSVALAAAALLASQAPAMAAGTLLDITLSTVPGFDMVINTDTQQIISFTIGGQSIDSGFTSSITTTPDYLSAYYTAQISAVATGGDINEIFNLDLEALNTPFPSTGDMTADAISLLTNAAELATNVSFDPNSAFPSAYTFSKASANGSIQYYGSTSAVSLPAGTTLVAAVPEPASMALIASAVFGLGLVRRRR